MPPATHLIIARDARGVADFVETPVGATLKDTVGFLATGQLINRTLEAVFAFQPGAVSVDVTARVLSEVAAYCEADESEVPDSLLAAFEAAGVPLPVQPPADWADVYAEHRLTRGCYGLSAGRL